MTIDELKKKISTLLGVSSSERELAFTIFIKKLGEQLAPGLTIKIPGLGFFQLKNNETVDKFEEILFSPLRESISDKVIFLSIDIPMDFYDESNEDTETFSIGVGKPIIPIGEDAGQDADASYIVFKKLIGERINDLLSESERIPDINIWDEYYKSEISGTNSDIKTELSELTADLNFDEEHFTQEVVNNIIDYKDKDTNPENFEDSDLTPSKLLEDYDSFNVSENNISTETDDEKEDAFGLEYLLENLSTEIPEGNIEPESESQLNGKDKIDDTTKNLEELIEGEKKQIDDNIELEKIVGNQLEEEDEGINPEDEKEKQEEDNEEQESKDELEIESTENDEKDSTTEIEIELGKHRYKNLEERIEIENTEEILDVEVDEEEEEFLGLRKRIQENTEWNWGDELRDELENYDDSKFDEEMEDVKEEDILKSTRPVSEDLFKKLETTIKEELQEAKVSTKYEFIEQKEESYKSTPAKDTYDHEQEIEDEEKHGYFKYGILGLFILVMFVGVVYLFFQGNKESNLETPVEQQSASITQNQDKNEIASLEKEQNENISDENLSVVEDDFPRVAKLEDKLNKKTSTPTSQTVDDDALYISPENDIHVYKTIFSDGAKYYVQTSSWRNESKAIDEVGNWKRKGYSSFIMKVNIPEKGGLWFRVRVGPFNSEAEARKFYEQNFQ
ncbi:SPOR domain-containing protein [Melioribacter sp. OK-6-Me]|uniref:SPOR domain-containing protein n=1 Tax=unclassified Melioribacter TaxID=2627329 RepID=UPI003EDB1C67